MNRDIDALIAFLEDREGWAFGYNDAFSFTHDCVRFCGAGVQAWSGRNPLAKIKSRWTTKRGARRVLARHGGMAAAVSSVMRPIDVTMAQRGDVGMLPGGELVLFEGEQVVGPAEPRGLKRAPRSMAVQAWTV